VLYVSKICYTRTIFVDLLRGPGIESKPGGPVQQPSLTVPAHQATLTVGIDSSNVYKFWPYFLYISKWFLNFSLTLLKRKKRNSFCLLLRKRLLILKPLLSFPAFLCSQRPIFSSVHSVYSRLVFGKFFRSTVPEFTDQRFRKNKPKTLVLSH
jgi:hypothetical protein